MTANDEPLGPTPLPELLSEKAVLLRWPVLSQDGLRAARARGAIGWVRGKRGSAWYRPEAVRQFISLHLERPVRPQQREAPSRPATSIAGMTPELEARAVEAIARRLMEPRPKRKRGV